MSDINQSINSHWRYSPKWSLSVCSGVYVLHYRDQIFCCKYHFIDIVEIKYMLTLESCSILF